MTESSDREKQSSTFNKTPSFSKLWVGRSSGKVAGVLLEIGESISLDIQLYKQDIRASIAHARMLCKIGIFSAKELDSLEKEMRKIIREIEEGSFPLDPQLEDIHTHIEVRLTQALKTIGNKLHTARSRNDQIAVDTHLYVRTASYELGKLLLELSEVLYRRAKENIDVFLPGYTHLQIAQPIRLSHYLLAYFWAFIRDIDLFFASNQTAQILPLGSGAFAGTNYKTDRELIKEDLKFRSIYPNSIDAVSNRDYLLNFLYACSMCMTHASRLSEEIILWNTSEFSYISLPDHLSTGSSIMPQKKNPDIAELVRGKSARVQSNLSNLFINLKSQPLSYNRDLQEDKHPLIDSFQQTHLSIRALTALIEEVSFHEEKMLASLHKGFSTATDLADSLVQEKKLTFREAHGIVGKLVSVCSDKGYSLESIPISERASIHPAFEDEIFYRKAIDISLSTEKKLSYGSTSLQSQKQQLKEASHRLSQYNKKSWNSPQYHF